MVNILKVLTTAKQVQDFFKLSNLAPKPSLVSKLLFIGQFWKVLN